MRREINHVLQIRKIWDGSSLRCDIYEMFVETVFAFFYQFLAGLFQQDGWQQLKQGNYAVIITHK
jgi:hypothetical protein